MTTPIAPVLQKNESKESGPSNPLVYPFESLNKIPSNEEIID